MQDTKRNFRQFHRKIAPVVFLPLLATAITGVIYRVGRSWFGMPRAIAGSVISIHTGEFLGEPLVPIYVALVGLSLVAMIVTGLTMWRSRAWGTASRRGNPQKLTGRKIHSWLTPILFLPLAVSAVTGIIYELGRDWFGLSPQQAAFFLGIHQGTYLGSFLRVFYVLLIGVGLVAFLITGINMTGIFRRKRKATET